VSTAPEFVFACHRCGLCCRAGHGRVWIEPEDVGALAAACGEDVDAFAARRVTQAGGRLSLREGRDGACTLLEDGNRCRAYEARPAQCRSFPFWPAILAGGPALDAAAGMCPGIQRIPERALAAAVLPRAARLIRAAAPSATAREGGVRWWCSLEADLELAGWRPPAGEHGLLDERTRRALEDLAESSGYPWSAGPAARLLAERAAGWSELRGGPPSLDEGPE
jgi:Fe-S-cluster containining protein